MKNPSPIELVEMGHREQQKEDSSFIGGQPRIPRSIRLPTCHLCHSPQSFFFQIAFPELTILSGFTMAVFSCTTCAHRDFLIPPMLEGQLQGIEIPTGFLNSYQENFRLMVFKTELGQLRVDYDERVRFQPLGFQDLEDREAAVNKIGGSPTWVLDDESPSTYGKVSSMAFLMQIVEDQKFPIHDHAPPQKKLFGPSRLPPNSYYELFIGNFIYFFTTLDLDQPLVYAITQVD